MKMMAGGKVYDLENPDENRAFLRALSDDIDRENRTPLWERALLITVVALMVLVILSAVSSAATGGGS